MIIRLIRKKNCDYYEKTKFGNVILDRAFYPQTKCLTCENNFILKRTIEVIYRVNKKNTKF